MSFRQKIQDLLTIPIYRQICLLIITYHLDYNYKLEPIIDQNIHANKSDKSSNF